MDLAKAKWVVIGSDTGCPKVFRDRAAAESVAAVIRDRFSYDSPRAVMPVMIHTDAMNMAGEGWRWLLVADMQDVEDEQVPAMAERMGWMAEGIEAAVESEAAVAV